MGMADTNIKPCIAYVYWGLTCIGVITCIGGVRGGSLGVTSHIQQLRTRRARCAD